MTIDLCSAEATRTPGGDAPEAGVARRFASVGPRSTPAAGRRWRSLAGPAAMLGASGCFLGGAAIAVPALSAVGPLGSGALRFGLAAGLLALLSRPRLRGRDVAEWRRLVATGTAMAVMTLSSYAALARMPLGTVATIEYLGPFAVAIGYRRARADLVSAGVALVGVALITGPSLTVSAVGVAYACLTAGALATYLVLVTRAADGGGGLETLTLTLLIAALLTMPFSVVAAPSLTSGTATRLAASALVGVGIAYALDFAGIRRVGGRGASVLLSFDPAVGALVGLLILGQALTTRAALGIVAVVLSGLFAASVRGVAPRPGRPPSD